MVIVVSSTIMGYFFGKSKTKIIDEYDELDEIMEYLNKYHLNKPGADSLYEGAINGAISSLDDPYTYVVEPNQHDGYIGLTYGVTSNEYYVSKVLEDSPFYNLLYTYDKIISINDVATSNMKKDEFLKLIDVDIDVDVKIKVLRGTKEIEINKKSISQAVCTSKKLDSTTGYIKFNEFSSGSASKFKNSLEEVEDGIDTLLIDLRNNPGGNLVELRNIVDLFVVNKGTAYMSMDNYDGTKEYYYTTNTTKKSYDIKILVNSATASAAEALTSIMSEYMGYEVIGEKTYGKGVYQTTLPLKTKEGYYLNCTLGYWYTPSGNTIHKKGITPDKFVSNDTLYIPSGFDLEIDSVSSTTKNAQIMLSNMGYTGRCDGYFDLVFLGYLQSNYDTTTLTEDVYYGIVESYYEYIAANDKYIDMALS